MDLIPTEPAYVKFKLGVPIKVRLVGLDCKIVVSLPSIFIDPVPKFIVLTLL